MTDDKRFKSVFEGESVAAFMSSFVLDEAARAALESKNPDADFSRFPKDTQTVLQDVKAIWQDKGFVTPAELETALIEKYIPDAAPELRSFIADIEAARNMPDPVTGYLPKEHAYLATGLAHLYTQETGQKMTMAEIDFSNMGGTNDYFRALLAREKGCAVEKIDERAARAMTDQAVLVLCKGMTDDLADILPKEACIIPIRTGGDELRLLIGGVSDTEKLADITDSLHTGIEMRAAMMGLQDHPHLKDPENPVRNGFGAAMALQDMSAIIKTNSLIQELDADISSAKKRIGLIRLGKISEEVQRQGWEKAIEQGTAKIPAGQSKESFVESLVMRDAERAAEVSAALRILNPQHNPLLTQGTKGFDAVVKQQLNLPSLRDDALFPCKPLQQDLSHASLAHMPRQDHLPPMTSLQKRREALVAGQMKDKGITLTAAHQRLLCKALGGLAAVDPAAGVMMPQVMAPTLDAWAKDATANTAGGQPQAMVVSFHNLAGLNGALGHHYSDLVLHKLVGIIEKSLAKAGLSAKMPEPVLMAHEGGANFTLAVSGTPENPVTPEKMKTVQENISRYTEALNKSRITLFLLHSGVADTQRLRGYLQRAGLGTFSDVQDPKTRTMEVNGQAISGLVNGLGVVSAVAPVQADVKGYALLDKLRDEAEEKMGRFRQGALVNDYMARVLRKLSLSEQFNTVATGNHRVEAGAVYRMLPTKEMPDMPPEVQSLIEIKKQNIGTHSRSVMRNFERQYNTLLQDGGLIEVGKWLQKNGVVPPKITPAPLSRFGAKHPKNPLPGKKTQ